MESRNLYYGPGGAGLAPRAPYRFIENNGRGASKKVVVRDARNRVWEVKFGPEAKPEVFASRLAWALGYYADPTYLVRSGRIGKDTFRDARFELRNPNLKYRPDIEWTWEKNPFSGSRELNGLRILTMLLSDWDNKDARDRNPNLGVLQSRNAPVFTYFVNDWGRSMGRWSNCFLTRNQWDCVEYGLQTKKFVKAVEGGELKFGFRGQHDGDFKDNITTDDVRWLMQYLGRVRNSQIRAALRASAAGPNEQACFTQFVRRRIEQLRWAANLRGAATRASR